ncbi:MAG: DUF1553 domain-containing protein [Planctomycetes bacterium]|nr:DUF1553 domain-containing protein [Planctomycetota bacterium]
MQSRSLLPIWFVWVSAFLASGWAGRSDFVAGAEIDYQREIAPILNEHCTHCHGADAAQRQNGLRLDRRDEALRGGDSGKAAIVPGKPDQSELIRRITTADQDEMMPPASEKKRLTAAQIDLLTGWIAAGAAFADHWAFIAPHQSPMPDNGPRHPVDALVEKNLRAQGLTPTGRAPAATLCRRLYLDLIGLPPTPAELAEFERVGIAATIEQLLRSERYGEKWARHWLDVARYSDTNGYEKDMPREQWSWRDWVIDALNRDLPYDQFLIEQIAGDLLPNATQEQRIATGFLRNSMINEEGAIVPEQFRMVEMFDRMDCIGKAVLGLTTQCAQCHSHKFDPITQSEYYGMFAFLNNSYEARSWVYAPDQRQQLAKIEAELRDLEQQVKAKHPDWEQKLAAWERAMTAQRTEWTPIEATLLESISGLNHPTQESDKSILMLGHTSADVFFVSAPELSGVTGLRLEALNHGDLPHRGPGRSNLGTWAILEMDVLVRPPDSQNWEKLKLQNATTDFSEPDQKSADGKKSSGPVAYLIDGTDDTSWRADRGNGHRNQPSVAVVQFEKPLEFPAGTQLKVVLRMGDMLGCCRVSLTKAPNPSAPPVAHAANLALESPSERRTETERKAIFSAWRKSMDDLQALNEQIDGKLRELPAARTSVLHLAEREPWNLRRTHSLERGNWDQPRQEIAPHVPTAFHPLPTTGPHSTDSTPGRLRFARWLADAESPLTARVAVNRVWQAIFGTGLVETAEDFGTRAAVPEHRELLDWLAVDFMRHGWSQKHLIATILSSATYQRDSRLTPQLAERDPRNRWLARGPRFRADGEVVRDIALSVSGLIAHRIGGPGVIPPVPQNVLDYNYTYPSYWKPTEGPDRYRRAVYLFRKRSMPDPVMNSFDAPNGDFSCARRIRSNTPLAALTGLNEPIFVEAAQALALRVLREAGKDDGPRIDYAYLLCTARKPHDAERSELLALLKEQRQRIADGWLNAREIATGDATRLPQLPEGCTPQDAAAWTIAARVMLNLDETISKN